MCEVKSIKNLCFDDKELVLSLNIRTQEIVAPGYGLHIWPSAPVLAQYVWFNRHKVNKKCVLELGSGTAIPGIVAAKVGGLVTLSDASCYQNCLDNCKEICLLNDIENVEVIGITWGLFEETLKNLHPQDIILASDCFYDKNDFEHIIALISYLLDKNESAEFWTTYQERNVDRCIDHLLLKWGLIGEEVPLQEFDANHADIAESNLPGCHLIRMFIIRKAEQTQVK